MKPANLTVLELFQKQQRYVVPLFQRPYIWTLEKQWRPLWEDIKYKAHELLEQRTGQHQEINNHFLGAVVLTTIKTAGLQVWAKSIIDGQQRLTTLQVILIALRDFANTIHYEDAIKTLELHTVNYCKVDTAIEKYKVWPTQADRQIFEDIFNVKSYDEIVKKYPPKYEKRHRHPNPLPLLVDAYKFFYEAISDFVTEEMDNGLEWPQGVEKPTAEEKVDALISAFKNHLEIVTIDLDETDNPQTIFETLNFRGEPLTPADLIRNFVFLEANRKKLQTEQLYNIYWFGYDKPSSNGNAGFWKQFETQGRMRIQRLDLFFFHYLTFKTEKEILLTRLYPEFKSWWEKENDPIEAKLKDLLDYSNIFEQFYSPDLDTRLGVFERRLKLLDNSTLYPFLLSLLGERSDMNSIDLNKIVIDLESYLIRRIVCNLSAKNYNNVFGALLNNFRALKNPSVIDLESLLLGLKSDSSRWPDDKEFEEKWYSMDAYHRRGVRVVLEAIDLQLMTSKQEQVHIDSQLTIEHILPQGWNKNTYPLPELNEGESVETLTIHRNSLLHTYGNLTLLTNALNASVSNGPFITKRPEIAKQSLLKLNSYFQEYADQWTEEDILTRGKKLFEIAKTIWPYPDKK
jgi:uncharacterized protein with ParB-like and HNH nuclease domain